MALKVFVSCSSNWPQLNDFRELLTTLGYEPIIVEKKESLGKDPDDKSHHYMKECDKIVFVITADAVDKNGRFHPTSNVAIEIGWSNEVFNDEDKVYILVDNAQQPSMINPTYIHFREGNYIRAIIQLIKELGYRNTIEYEDLKIPDLSEKEISCLEFFLEEDENEILAGDLFGLLSKKIDISLTSFKLIINKLLKYDLIEEVYVLAPYPLSGRTKCYKLAAKALDILYELKKGK